MGACRFETRPRTRRWRIGRRVTGALWYTFDNDTDKATLIATTEETQSPMVMPTMPASEYIKVDLSAVGGPEAWSQPVSAYFRRNSGGWALVGFERQP